MVLVTVSRPQIRVSIVVLSMLVVFGCTSVDDEWATAKTKNTLDAYQSFLLKYPNSKYTAEAGGLIRDLTPVRGRLFALMPMPMGGNLALKLQGRAPAYHFSLYSLEGQSGDFEIGFTADTHFLGKDNTEDPSKMVDSGDEYEISGKHRVETRYREVIAVGYGASGGLQREPIEVRIIEARTVRHLGAEQDQRKQ